MTTRRARDVESPEHEVAASMTGSDPRSRSLELDVLAGFAEAPEVDDPIPGPRGLVATSVGVLAAIVLGSLGFVTGMLWGISHEPDLGYQNLAAEIAIKIAYAVLSGAALASVVVALCFVVAGVVWMRHRSASTRPRPATIRHTRRRSH